jgi:photosystem II stability/assembly factor-like uncharacterized protein
MVQIKAWQQVQLPVATTLYDIAFDTAEPSHGFVVGAKGTFLEVMIVYIYIHLYIILHHVSI